MGILNATPDSFSDGGRFYQRDAGLIQAEKMLAAGVDIIDIGGESTRPGAEPVGLQEELDRVLPIIEALKDCGVALSIDTYKPQTMQAALAMGVDCVNDIWALRQAGAWIPPRSVIPAGSVAHRIRSSGNSATETGEVSQDVWFDNWEKGLDLWELSRHYQRTDTTISLLWFDSDDLPEVEVNRFGARVEDDGGLAELTGELPWPGRSRRR